MIRKRNSKNILKDYKTLSGKIRAKPFLSKVSQDFKATTEARGKTFNNRKKKNIQTKSKSISRQKKKPNIISPIFYGFDYYTIAMGRPRL